MARIDTHSRVVAWLKIALPLVALALLSSLFMLADQINPNDALSEATVDVEDRARAPRMTQPTYAGITSDGAALTLTATEARPASETTKAVALGLALTLDTPDGGRNKLSAKTAVIDSVNRNLHLSGGVEMTTSTGYSLVTEGITANLDRTGLQSSGKVAAEGPAGDIIADNVTLSQDNQTPGAYLLVFKGGVKLIYQPGG
ncbi:hypothetical protein [Tabrizicola sp.]|uniref:hypothetical protein n=1 Tax=Tabrizicola sp. TaxID=2005166 RepID=UPI00286C2450|nr:hypothetical protein [Tabrizicola sp.]